MPTAGQLILMLTPAAVSLICTSSARPAITARPRPCSKPGEPPGSAAAEAPRAAMPARSLPPAAPAVAEPPAAPVSVTSTSNLPAASVSAILTGSAGQYRRCASTAREHASPTARRTSSSSASSTPLRRATAVATSRAVRTCAGSGVKVTSTVAIGGRAPALLLELLGLDGPVHRLVDAEHLRQPGDPEDLEDALLRAHQVQGAVVRPHPLQAADQHAESGGVEELDLLHIHDELVVVLVDEIDEQLTEPWGRVNVDLALDIDDLDAVLVVVTQLQIHKILQRHARRHLIVPHQARGLTSRAYGVIACGIQPRSGVMSIRNHASRHPLTGRHTGKSPIIAGQGVTLIWLCRP